RFLTLYFFGPLFKLFCRNKGVRIPILMYHSISDEKESGHPYYWLNTSPKRFYEHMKFLKDNTYKVISLTETASIISKLDYPYNPSDPSNSTNQSNPINPINSNYPNNSINPINSSNPSNSSNFVVLTFDDGYRDFYTTAWPILSQFSFPVTVFLPTGFIGGSFKKQECLSWSEVRKLYSQGISFGSHTVTHRQLHSLSWKDIKIELENSKKALEDQLGAYVVDFSYPYDYPETDKVFCERLASILEDYGYTHCVTTRLGCSAHGDDVLSLKRLPINDSDDPFLFKAKLKGSYDWLGIMQRFLKALKRNGCFI
ncbi:MAG: polysaccharide deacetylase family protein, partial [Halobacteria archaeon]